MWANVADGGPTITQLWFVSVPPTCRYRSMKYWLGLNGYWPASATLAHHLTDIGSCRLVIAASSKQYQISCYSQQTQNICITFIQRRPNIFDVGSTLYKCYTNVYWVERSPANTRRWTSAGLMLSQRRRRWDSIGPALSQRRVCWECWQVFRTEKE